MITLSFQHGWLIPMVALLGASISPAASVSGAAASLSVTDPTTQLSFTSPSTFHLARYLDTPLLPPAQRDALPRVLVLAEQTLHQGQAPIVISDRLLVHLE